MDEVDPKIEEALARLKAEITDDIIERLQTPSSTSTRYKLTIYLMILTGVITIAIMAMSALKIPVPEIATGVILMGIFNALLQALNSYFEAKKETDLAKIR
jgi:hypothetical protein